MSVGLELSRKCDFRKLPALILMIPMTGRHPHRERSIQPAFVAGLTKVTESVWTLLVCGEECPLCVQTGNVRK